MRKTFIALLVVAFFFGVIATTSEVVYANENLSEEIQESSQRQALLFNLSQKSLYTLDELILNSGQRGENFHYGMFPKLWKNSISHFLIMFQFLGILAIVTRMIAETTEKNNWYKFIKATIFLLLIGIFIEYVILKQISLFTGILKGELATEISIDNLFLEATESSSAFVIKGEVIRALLHTISLLLFNILYLIRKINFVVFLVTSPLFVVSSVLNTNYNLLKNYLSKVLELAFFQLFHLLLLLPVFHVNVNVQVRALLAFICLFASINALNSLFKSESLGDLLLQAIKGLFFQKQTLEEQGQN